MQASKQGHRLDMQTWQQVRTCQQVAPSAGCYACRLAIHDKLSLNGIGVAEEVGSICSAATGLMGRSTSADHVLSAFPRRMSQETRLQTECGARTYQIPVHG